MKLHCYSPGVGLSVSPGQHLGLSCYELLRPQYPGVKEIFKLLPNCQPEDLLKFDNKVLGGMKGGEKVSRVSVS